MEKNQRIFPSEMDDFGAKVHQERCWIFSASLRPHDVENPWLFHAHFKLDLQWAPAWFSGLGVCEFQLQGNTGNIPTGPGFWFIIYSYFSGPMFLQYPRGNRKCRPRPSFPSKRNGKSSEKNETPPTIIKTSIKSSLKKKKTHPKSS